MLLMVDREFYSFDLIVGVGQRGAQALGRLAAHVRPKPVQPLADGSTWPTFIPRRPAAANAGNTFWCG
jgi:hypothetical protein